jgi:hypothetical protein
MVSAAFRAFLLCCLVAPAISRPAAQEVTQGGTEAENIKYRRKPVLKIVPFSSGIRIWDPGSGMKFSRIGDLG